jgi:hypothetical protein
LVGNPGLPPKGVGKFVVLGKDSRLPDVPADRYVPIDVCILEEVRASLRGQKNEKIEGEEQNKHELGYAPSIRGHGYVLGAIRDDELSQEVGLFALYVSWVYRTHMVRKGFAIAAMYGRAISAGSAVSSLNASGIQKRP